MEVQNTRESNSMFNNSIRNNRDHAEDGLIDEDDVPLPGFRFHPTDEELVDFYLRRKVDNKPIALELIKQIDIYKYDPWDLPKGSNVGDKEWYFYCKRGRKYRNSIRPNRVTGSGFWKATGIDRPICSSSASAAGGDITSRNRHRVGLKKSLVYYCGSAGKGTKTDWMMHEFRLPLDDKTIKPINDQEAEVWTLCRIIKRNVSYKKCVPDWREICAAATATAKRNTLNDNDQIDASSKSCSIEPHSYQSFISFTDPPIRHNNNNYRKPFSSHAHKATPTYQLPVNSQLSSSVCEQQTPSINMTPTSYSNVFSANVNNEMLLKQGGDNWDELGSLVGFAADPFVMYN